MLFALPAPHEESGPVLVERPCALIQMATAIAFTVAFMSSLCSSPCPRPIRVHMGRCATHLFTHQGQALIPPGLGLGGLGAEGWGAWGWGLVCMMFLLLSFGSSSAARGRARPSPHRQRPCQQPPLSPRCRLACKALKVFAQKGQKKA